MILFVITAARTREVMVGHVGVGGANPIRVQSMITCDTMDTEASIAADDRAGAGRLRDRADHCADGEGRGNLQHIVKGLRERGCDVPIVADIHFKPEAAMEAAKWVEKVRINPGNYADSKKFVIREYTRRTVRGRAGAHSRTFSAAGQSLQGARDRHAHRDESRLAFSDRIMNRYGDTPLGMVESALEFARIARDLDYHDFIFSMKSSNPKVMIAAYRLLVARLNERGPGLELSDSSRRDRGGRRRRRADQKRHRHRLAACATASATRFAFRSPKTACTKFRWRER